MKALLQQALLILFVITAMGIGSFGLGWRAWRQGSRDLDEHIDVSEKPEDWSNNRWRRHIRRGRRRKRLIRSALWATGGAVLGLLAVFAYALYRRR